MKTQRQWCGFVGWFLAASMAATPARLVFAADTPQRSSITINRGETYVIKGLSAGSSPEVKPIDNPKALIVNKQPDGNLLVLGADAGIEAVQVQMADGKQEIYTFTVKSELDRNNPLVPGSAPGVVGDRSMTTDEKAETLDPGTGPASPSDGPNTKVKATSVATGGSSALAAPAASAPNAGAAPAGTPPAPVSISSTGSSKAADNGATAIASASSVSHAGPMGLNSPVEAAIASQDSQALTIGPETQEPSVRGTHGLPDDAITMMFGTSKVFDFANRIRRVSVADSNIADLQVINPHQLMLIGHKPGFTTLAVWDNQGHYEERQVRIEQTGHQQVLLNYLVGEVNRTELENQGINLSGSRISSGLSIVGQPGQVATPYSPSSQLQSSGQNGSTSGGILPFGGQLIPLLLSSNLTYGLAYDHGNYLAQGFFQYLEQHQLGRILAEPHLLANSGQEAKFLEGGEIPIVLAQALNTSVVFKQYGTSVVFIPTVVGKHDIELVVKPEVSQPDFTHGVQLFGFTVPAFVTRRADTVVRMKEKQTLIIAGLIVEQKAQTVNKVPYLGDIPFAGALFRNTGFSNIKTELVMSVTPEIVGALPPGTQVRYPDRSMTRDDTTTRRMSTPDVARPRF
jgi:pilus assembly protein CpaC